jgi:hypothetical protein
MGEKEVTMLIDARRDSVANGDDRRIGPFDLPPETSLAAAVAHLREEGFLATIRGGKATWTLEAGDKTLAVVAQQWTEPRFLVDPARPITEFASETGEVTLTFRYYKQRDPAQIFKALTTDRNPTRPPR